MLNTHISGKPDTYFKKLAVWARWFMPRSEAGDFLEDYRELLAGEDEGSALRRFGPPFRAVLAAADKRQAALWHVMFLIMAALLVFPAVLVIDGVYVQLSGLISGHLLSVLLLAWFGVGRESQGSGRMSSGLFSAFLGTALVEALICGVVLFFCKNVSSMWGRYLGQGLRLCTVIFALAGIAGIALSRICDRRWRSVTVLCGAGIAVCLYILSVICSMEPIADPAYSLVMLWRGTVLITGAGILTAGVSLC